MSKIDVSWNQSLGSEINAIVTNTEKDSMAYKSGDEMATFYSGVSPWLSKVACLNYSWLGYSISSKL